MASVTVPAPQQTEEEIVRGLGDSYQYGWKDEGVPFYQAKQGLSHEVVDVISDQKDEPDWMRKFRHKALDYFFARPLPTWGADLSEIDFDSLSYYVRPLEHQANDWVDLPDDIKATWDRLGIPEAERKFLAGVGAMYDSEVVYHKIQQELEAQGVIFLDTDTALKEHEELFRKYFATVIPPNDNKLAALNSAVWSGGSFIYIPPGVKVEMPLQAYFRISSPQMTQAERTLIIADEGSSCHYIEGCSATMYSSESLHTAVVELVALPGADLKYTTLQSWYKNVYNLVTKRAVAWEDAKVSWLDVNTGARKTMKYPGIWLMGKGASGEVLSVAFANDGQHQDTGAKIVHAAPDTTSIITSKSISKGTGRASYRGLLEVAKGAHGAKSKVVCDALLLDPESRTDTYPYIRIDENEVDVGHEATVSKVGEDTIFYLCSRGLTEAEATAMIINGFIEPISRRLPIEYSVEMQRLIELEMEGSVG